MLMQSSTFARLRSAMLIAGVAVVFTVLPARAQKQLPMEPIHDVGQPVTPSYEGWWADKDGNYNFGVWLPQPEREGRSGSPGRRTSMIPRQRALSSPPSVGCFYRNCAQGFQGHGQGHLDHRCQRPNTLGPRPHRCLLEHYTDARDRHRQHSPDDQF